MSLTEDLYREIILEHFREPRNYGQVANANLHAQGTNPFCGDEIEISAKLSSPTAPMVQELMTQGKGCSISQASASLMTEALKNQSLDDAARLAAIFKEFLLSSNENQPTLPEALSELEVLAGVKKYPVRIKCAILAWNTFLEGVQQYKNKQVAAAAPAAPATPMPDDPAVAKEELRAALKTVIDPEINMNIVDLGLVYGIDVAPEGQTRITYTLTSPGCPLGPVIKAQAEAALKKVSWVKQVRCDLVWTPPWDPKTMASEEAKMELGLW